MVLRPRSACRCPAPTRARPLPADRFAPYNKPRFRPNRVSAPAPPARRPAAPRHGIAARVVGAEALREEDPDRYGRRVNPSLPKPSCCSKGIRDTIFRKQRGEVQIAVPASVRHCGLERLKHLWPPCHEGIGLSQQPLVTSEAFYVHIAFPRNDLRKFKCHSGILLSHRI